MVGLGKRGLGLVLLSLAPVEADIVDDVVMDPGRPIEGRTVRVGCGREHVVVDLDQLGGVTGLLQGISNDKGDGFAHMTDLLLGEQRAVGFAPRRPVEIGDREHAGHGPQIVGFDVIACQDQQHAGRSLCS